MSAREFLLPDLGEGLTEAEIIAWHVAVGEHVSVDQVVCEVETAKASVEVPCPYAGEVVELHGAVGDVVDVGKPLISIAAAVAVGAAPEEPADRARLDAEARNGKAKQSSGNVLVGYGTAETGGVRRRRVVSGFGGHGAAPPRVHVAPVAVPANAEPVATKQNGGRIAVISPLVRRLAKEGGLDLASVQGSGPEGLIMRRDVEAALATPAPAPSSTGIAERERVPLRGLRKTVADKLSRSRREIPDATTWVDVDATGLMELRAALNKDASARKISLLAVLARICVAGLARYPELNATVDVERQEIVRYADVNLGFAAQTDRGLVVPVVHGAHLMSTEELAAEFERLTAAARAGSLPVSDLTGSTFTLNNYGVYGVDGSTPILNHPEAAMLGVGRIVKKPWVVDDQLAVRHVTQLSFTFDHRVCDGGVAGGFLRYVADLVEEPARLLRGL
ncbi:2-oxoisovalerate dehydrogenase E2 component (dihydrolipoyl transacylase) [Catenulispora sp. GP43]|uniref:dihydrolipoamide acetyltransferase family protein n=1 Tax=Catenulispora sp. GP43 TaxID=3156263 RepID=UPI003515AD13